MRKSLILPIILSTLDLGSIASADNSQLDANNDQWTCESSAFPMRIDLKIYLRNGHYIAQLNQVEYSTQTIVDNDGDVEHQELRWASDVIEVKLTANDREGLRFEQVEGLPVQSLIQLNVPPNGISKCVQIFIANKKDPSGYFFASILAPKSPLGELAADSALHCW